MTVNRDDVIRQANKALDVLQMVAKAMLAEAEMNAAKHLNPSVRPAPLAAAVVTQIDDLTRDRIRDSVCHGRFLWSRTR